MSRLAAVLVLMAVLGAAAAPAPAFAFANPTPVASPSAAATAAPSDSFAGDARALLGGSLAEAVAAQAQLGSSLAENAAQRESVRRELGATDARIAELDASIAARDVQIDDVRRRADWERAQVTALARAIDGQPLSIIQRLVQTRGLAELVAGVADLTSAGRRGDALADALDRDREQLEREQEEQREERANQADMRARQQADLEQLQRLMAEEGRVAASLAASVRRTRSELARSRPGDAALADRVLRALLADQASLVAAGVRADGPGHRATPRRLCPLPHRRGPGGGAGDAGAGRGRRHGGRGGRRHDRLRHLRGARAPEWAYHALRSPPAGPGQGR